MLRKGNEYRDSLRDGREVWVDGEKVNDVSTHPVFKPIVDIRARIYDMAHEEKFSKNLTYTDEKSNEKNCIGSKLPKSKNDWLLKREAIKTIMYEIGAVVTRVGDETAGEMWSLFDGQDVETNLRGLTAVFLADKRSSPLRGLRRRPPARPLSRSGGRWEGCRMLSASHCTREGTCGSLLDTRGRTEEAAKDQM